MGIPHLSLFSTVYILAHLPITNQNFASLPNAKMDFLKKGADMLNKNKDGGSAQQQNTGTTGGAAPPAQGQAGGSAAGDRIMVIRHSVSSPRRQDTTSTPAPARRSPMARVACTRSRLEARSIPSTRTSQTNVMGFAGRRLILSGRTRC